jgi:hypothetical protein
MIYERQTSFAFHQVIEENMEDEEEDEDLIDFNKHKASV